MNDIVKMGANLKKYMDGDIVFAFNKVGVDSTVVKSGRGGMHITDANYFYVKRSGQPPVSSDKLSADIKDKIAEYVPPGVDWKN
jgi:hypothetical protein